PLRKSLFEELFPEDSTFKEREEKTAKKLPTFEWHDAPEIDWKETMKKTPAEKTSWSVPFLSAAQSSISTLSQTKAASALRQRKSEVGVLVLRCASKTLEESDFFRLGSKGQHIEGWTSGILNVIQCRDTITLEPLGHYYLVFSSEAAALAYLDHTLRLHTLSKTHVSGVSSFPIPSKFLRPGEDIKKVLRGYSLVPGQSRLSLRLLNRPYSPKVTQLLSDGGPAAVARQKTKSEHMVLFSVDLGRITHFDIRHAISNDGRRRNLHWSLKNGGENAIFKINSDIQNTDSHDPATENRQSRRSVRGPARYILSFKDTHEARRFVREWHRRPFPVEKEHKVGAESPSMMHAEMFQ
ncbi:hypothetical protein D0Z07_3262, partial [Hyphodiscus hymeniophilus]